MSVSAEDYIKKAIQVKDGVVYWRAVAEGIGWATHKFTILDAIETASQSLKGKHTERYQTVHTGRQGWLILQTLPKFIFVKGEGFHGRRRIIHNPRIPEDLMKLVNPESSISIRIVEE